MKRNLYYIPFFLLTILHSACSEKEGGQGTRPNIIFIMSDDHAVQAISAYGHGLNKTPHIDRLADEGMLFRKAFVTNSICAPSRAVVLTGKHSHLNGVRDNHTRFDSTQITFPKILQENGYETAIVGKWHLKSGPTGFDYWNILPGQGDYYNPAFIKNGADTVYGGYVTDITTDIALEWLDKRETDKPFMLMVHHKAPHRNWMPNLPYLDAFEDSQFSPPSNYDDTYEGREHLLEQQLTIKDHMDMRYDLKIPCDTCPVAEVNNWSERVYDKKMEMFTEGQRNAWEKGYKQEVENFFSKKRTEEEMSRWKFNRYMQDYLRCIISVDESVGKISRYLEENGLDENTLVIYTSDQGFYLGEHGLFDKRYMYEESFRTPLIMKYPSQISAGLSDDHLVQNLDIAPTILNVAGVPIPDDFQGMPISMLFGKDKKTEWRDAIYYHFYESGWGVPKHYGVRTKDHKLIHILTEEDSWELYDLEKDPTEMQNVYADEAYRNVLEKLEMKLEELRIEYQLGSS